MIDWEQVGYLGAKLRGNAHRVMGLVEGQERRVEALRGEITAQEVEAAILTASSATLDRLLEALSVEAVGKVEQLVTHGLQTVFPDQQLQFRFEVTTKFRAPWLEPRVIHNGVEQPILDAFGGGVATLAAFILRIVVIGRMKLAPIVFLDEPFGMVSDEYLDRVAVLLKDLSRTLGLKIVMVTHLTSVFPPYADRAYRAEQGADGSTVFTPVDPHADSAGGGLPAVAP